MGVELPALSGVTLGERLAAAGTPVEPAVLARLAAHYDTLRSAAEGLSLIGAGTAEDAVERHYAESLLGRALCAGPGTLLEVGSGAGFPGLVLAACEPGRRAVLVERRQKKAAFLLRAARAMALDAVEVLAEDLDAGLSRLRGAAIDCVVMRAVRLSPSSWRRLCRGTRPTRIVHWGGVEVPAIPGYALAETVPVPGAERRVLRRFEPAAAKGRA